MLKISQVIEFLDFSPSRMSVLFNPHSSGKIRMVWKEYRQLVTLIGVSFQSPTAWSEISFQTAGSQHLAGTKTEHKDFWSCYSSMDIMAVQEYSLMSQSNVLLFTISKIISSKGCET
jgi:hypothetical protein